MSDNRRTFLSHEVNFRMHILIGFASVKVLICCFWLLESICKMVSLPSRQSEIGWGIVNVDGVILILGICWRSVVKIRPILSRILDNNFYGRAKDVNLYLLFFPLLVHWSPWANTVLYCISQECRCMSSNRHPLPLLGVSEWIQINNEGSWEKILCQHCTYCH